MNIVHLIGNVGKDPEMRALPGGQSCTTFSLATTEKWRDRDGAKQEATEWHNCVAFGKPAEVIAQYVTKGSKLAVSGSIKTRSWDDKQSGEKKYRTEIKVRDFEFIGSGGKSDAKPADADEFADLDIPL